MVVLICVLIFFSTCMHAQQTTMTLPHRISTSGIVPHRYFDPDARRISITVKTPCSEQIGEIPDITSLPYAFPASTPTPISSVDALRLQYTPKKQQAPAPITQLPDKKIAQKKSLLFCCCMFATKKQ